ncbi:MAG: hypothetical protein ACW98K_07240, partial [Candidatus Kariarchaeaceae archaeon]
MSNVTAGISIIKQNATSVIKILRDENLIVDDYLIDQLDNNVIIPVNDKDKAKRVLFEFDVTPVS